MSGNKKEFGDYQTPIDFCEKVCEYLYSQNLIYNVNAIVEPTCGLGNFIISAYDKFHLPIFGIEINDDYINKTHNQLPFATLIHDSIFNIDITEICPYKNVLVIGNPPWVTNSNLNYNLPQKSNFKKLRGIEAITGLSNFDICEYVILQMINAYKGTDSVICMLCKTSVARNIVLELNSKSISCDKVQMLIFDSHKVFGISAAACILIIQLSSKYKKEVLTCEIKDFNSLGLIDNLIVINNNLISVNRSNQSFFGSCQMSWRSGVKHDCGKVMELELNNGILFNKYKEIVDVEEDLIFPLVKSSSFKFPIIKDYNKYVIVTQKKPKQDTSYIEYKYPRLWSYLNSHIEDFNKRKSTIYKKSALFSMFGIGEYSFAPYKVGVSGFYKKPLFSLLISDKPVMTDDTSYFLSFYNYNDAYTMMLLLNSPIIQDYLISIAFLDSKRPYTVKLLSHIDLKRCINQISINELTDTEKILNLKSYITNDMLLSLEKYILSLSN